MYYQELLSRIADEPVTFSVVGAGGEYGRSLLAHVRGSRAVRPQVLCDVQVDGLRTFLLETGYDDGDLALVEDVADVPAALAGGRVVLTTRPEVALASGSQVLVESTGRADVGVDVVEAALERAMHVVMVNKEADAVAGPALARKAEERGLNYVFAHGDQPRNLIELLAWAQIVGLEVVAAGKSSEYDYVYDPAAGTLRHLDQEVEARGLDEVWHLGPDVRATLAERSRVLAAVPQCTPPDYGEMNLVANSTSLRPSRPEMHYPLARIPELADIYALRADGGVIESPGVLDVFNLLRRVDEPSFGGGVFVVVRAGHPDVWEVLRGKGHVVSRDGRYACVYLPYHLMGVETPVSIVTAALAPVGAHPMRPTERRAVVVVETERDFAAGEVLTVSGSHHTIDGTRALLLEWSQERADDVPYHLAGNNRLRRDVPRGTVLTADMIEFSHERLVALWRGDVGG